VPDLLAIIRPDDWNLPLFVHVLGAMALVGTLLVVSTALLASWRRDGDESALLARFGLWTLIAGVLPSYVVMRIGAQWVESAEELSEAQEESTWIGIGYITADLGALLILISIVLSAIGLRRSGGRAMPRAVGVIATVLVAAYLVAVWAMSAKPGA
jgi:hypothetical protein